MAQVGVPEPYSFMLRHFQKFLSAENREIGFLLTIAIEVRSIRKVLALESWPFATIDRAYKNKGLVTKTTTFLPP